MSAVRTVTGAIEAACLGHCQVHEHLFVRPGPATERHPALRIDEEALSARELARYRQAGGGAVVDAQPGGAGRDVRALARISRASGVPVVCVTGFHLPMFYPEDHWIFRDAERKLRDRFLAELTEDIVEEGPTGIRAGAVKAAIGPEGVTRGLRARLRAAAAAAAEAGVPLLLHTEKGAGAVEAVALFASCGLAPERVLVCHVDRQAGDYEPHERVADTGAYLEYDTVGRYKYHDDESEARLILHMLARGHLERLLLSLDTTRERLASYGGEIGLDYLLLSFLPRLREAGVTEDQIRAMTHVNPARAFGARLEDGKSFG